MKRKFTQIIPALVITATSAFMLMSVADADAAVGGACSECHVMHATQGATLAPAEPKQTLLKSDCKGCHTKTDNTGADIATPGIYITGSNEIAGGNYLHSVVTDISYGHNPKEMAAGIDRREPPGWVPGFLSGAGVAGASDGELVGVDDFGPGDDWATNDLSCSGVYGCHGKHLAGLDGSHHANYTGADIDGSTVGKSYRFLYGILGWEDLDYELTTGAGSHNIYYAVARDSDNATVAERKNTISYLCAQCHGIFHSGAGVDVDDGYEMGLSQDADTFGTSPWIRHPVDVVMPDGAAEQDGYVYTSVTPVGSSDVSDATINVALPADRIVMCLSCHRAHASDQPYALRFDYNMAIGDNQVGLGCFACHTEKDVPL